MDRGEMIQVIQRVLELDPKVKAVNLRSAEKRRIDPKPGASAAALEKLAEMFPSARLPPSYRMLLELHDGIQNFKYVSSSILSCERLLRLGHDGRTSIRAEKEPERIFFIVGEDWEGVAFDTTTLRPDGEMEVCDYNNTGENHRWASLPDFLLAYRTWLENFFAQTVADRSASSDDA